MDSFSTSLRLWLCVSLIAFLALSCNNQSVIQQTWMCVGGDLVSDDIDSVLGYSWISRDKDLWHFTEDSLFTIGISDCYSKSPFFQDNLITLNDSSFGEVVYSSKDSLSVLTNGGRVAYAFVPFVSENTLSKSEEELWSLLVAKSWSLKLEDYTWLLNFKDDRYRSECGYHMSASFIEEPDFNYYEDMWWGISAFKGHVILNFGFNEEWNFKIISWAEDRIVAKYLHYDFTWQEVIFESKE